MKDMKAAAWRWRAMLLAKAEHSSTTEIEAGALRDKAARLTLKYGLPAESSPLPASAPSARVALPSGRAREVCLCGDGLEQEEGNLGFDQWLGWTCQHLTQQRPDDPVALRVNAYCPAHKNVHFGMGGHTYADLHEEIEPSTEAQKALETREEARVALYRHANPGLG